MSLLTHWSCGGLSSIVIGRANRLSQENLYVKHFIQLICIRWMSESYQYRQLITCLDVARAPQMEARRSPSLQELALSSLWAESTANSRRETSPCGLALVLLSTWMLSWSTWLLRSWSQGQQDGQDRPLPPPAWRQERWGACGQVFKGITISQGGVLLNIHSVLLPKKLSKA